MTLVDLEDAVPALLIQLKTCGLGAQQQEVARVWLVKFLGVVWSGKTKVISDVAIDKI